MRVLYERSILNKKKKMRNEEKMKNWPMHQIKTEKIQNQKKNIRQIEK